MNTYVFDKDDYIELYRYCGIAVFKFDNHGLAEEDEWVDVPQTVVTYCNSYLGHLSNVPPFNRNIRDILLHFYKAMAYHEFQCGDTWRGCGMEIAVREAFSNLVGDDIWHKATNGNWFTRWNVLPLEDFDDLSEPGLEAAMRLSKECGGVMEPVMGATAMGTMQFMGSNGAGVSNSSLIMTLTISANMTCLPSSMGSRDYSKSRLVLSEAVAMGHKLPTWKELYNNNRELITVFLKSAK